MIVCNRINKESVVVVLCMKSSVFKKFMENLRQNFSIHVDGNKSKAGEMEKNSLSLIFC